MVLFLLMIAGHMAMGGFNLFCGMFALENAHDASTISWKCLGFFVVSISIDECHVFPAGGG